MEATANRQSIHIAIIENDGFTSRCFSLAIDVVRTACQYRRYCQVVASNVTFETNCTGEMSLNISYECVAGES